ncbi:MAG: hypothetical protein ACFB03_16270 [Paracoccaceae bacterium]
MKSRLILIVAALLLGACTAGTQTTSGAAYLARAAETAVERQTVLHRTALGHGKESVETIESATVEDLVRKAAAVEPVLPVPARIALVRIERGTFSLVPTRESKIWQAAFERHAALGSLSALDPFIAEYAYQAVLPDDHRRISDATSELLSRVRIGAARQHFDAVLVYEVGAQSRKNGLEHGLSSITVLARGPMRSDAPGREGLTRAVLIDVRNGYPYASATAEVDLDLPDRAWWDDSDQSDHSDYDLAVERLVTALTARVEQQLAELVRAREIRLAAVR